MLSLVIRNKNPTYFNYFLNKLETNGCRQKSLFLFLLLRAFLLLQIYPFLLM